MFDQLNLNKNIVNIEFIANGVLVILPVRTTTTDEFEKNEVRRQAYLHGIYKEESESNDSELNRIRGVDDFQEIHPDKKYRKMTVKEIRDEQIYQFKTLDEALEFIRTEFKN